MSKNAQKAARELLDVLPLVMRTLQLKMRQAEHLSSPAHFGILMLLAEKGRGLSEMANFQRVSLPTMSNSVSTLVTQGLVKRTRSGEDRRQVIIEITELGQQVLHAIQSEMETHLQVTLAELDEPQLRQLLDGFSVLKTAFSSNLIK